jgi:glycosyltransferase involved in cell wall biosynthesis
MKNTSARVKLLIIIRGLDIGGFNGGGDRFGLELAKALDPTRFRVSVCAFYRHHTHTEVYWENDLRHRDVNLFYATDWRENHKLLNTFRGIRQLERHFSLDHFDICHSHFQLGTLIALYMKLPRPKLVVVSTFHLKDNWSKDIFIRLRKWIFSDWIFPIFLNAEVGVSNDITFGLSNSPGSKLFRRKPRYIPNALSVNSNLSREQQTPDFGFTPGGNLIGTIGRLSKQKGIIYLIQSMKKILQELPDVDLIIIGDGMERNNLEEQAKQLGIDTHIHFLGSRQDIPQIFSRLDLFVLPSLFEGLPTVILESMYFGVPAVATDIPGTRELIKNGDNGWLVPVRNPDLLAQAIVTALKKPNERAKVKLNGFETSKSFTIENIAIQYENLYDEYPVINYN